MEGLVKITPNKEKARSIVKMVETTQDMIRHIAVEKYPSNITKEYYEVIRELMSVILLLDGYKTVGEGAHKRLIEYIKTHYSRIDHYQISLIDDLRITRNKIAYDGFFVKEEYIKKKLRDIKNIIVKLRKIIKEKLTRGNLKEMS